MSKLVAVTGASGYVGAYVVKDLLERGYRVRACVRDPENESKISFLKDMDKSESKSNIEFGGGDLERADYEKLFEGCFGVIHIATPYLHTAADPLNEIVKPAIQGTLRVLEACSKSSSSVKKVIITSSAGAVVNTMDPKLEPLDEYNDDCWNTSATLENHPYFYSKVQAEQAAWKFQKENDSNPSTNHFSLSVINPGFIVGPPSSNNLNTSLKLILRICFEAGMIIPNRAGIVDVRDVALAHILVLESNDTNKRYLVCGCVKEFKEIPLTAQKLFPDIKFNITPNIPVLTTKEWKANTSRIQSLGLNSYIDFNQSITDMFNQFSNFNLIK